MLSYQHGYHAGNHADVLKHLVLHRVLTHLNLKDKPWTFLDTHAGAGVYDLNSAMAGKNREHETGVERLRGAKDLPEPLAGWLRDAFDDSGRYRGSPALAAHLARENDQLIFFERHPEEFRKLSAAYRKQRHARCTQGDGYAAVKSALPPPSRRGAVLIDPSYELAEDWKKVPEAVSAGLERFATGVFMVWYPRLANVDGGKMVRRITRNCTVPWLHLSLDVDSPSARNLHGSGMVVLNPPWTLRQEFECFAPHLSNLAGGESVSRASLEGSDTGL